MTRKENYSPEVWANILASNERWRLANITRVREKERARRAARKATDAEFRERLAEQRRAWRKANRDKVKEQRKRARERRDAEKRRQERLAKKREYQRAYRAAHPDRVRESERKWKAANPDKVAAAQRKYAENRVLSPEARERKNASHRAWKKRNAERVRAYNREYARRRAAAKGRMTLKGVGEALETALGKNTLYAAAVAAVPRTLPRDVRMDVVSAIVLAVLEGEFAEADIASEAKRFVTAHYRMFDQFKHRSLDAVIPGTENLRLGDTIASDAFHF